MNEAASREEISTGRPRVGGYGNYLRASYSHAALLMMRRQRLIFAVVIAFLPALLPLAGAMFSTGQFVDKGNELFVELVKNLHILALAPLMALFFATMLIAEEVEGMTMPYMLTRPMPRSAWVLGRFLAYIVVAGSLIVISIGLTFLAATTLPGLGFNLTDLWLMLHYMLVALAAICAYGAFMQFIGAFSRRPIIIGVIIIYGWQRVVRLVPGVIDFLTIEKYVDALMPVLATQRHNEAVQTALAGFQRDVFLISGGKAAVVLALLTAAFLGLSIASVRLRDYTATRARGA